jgi:Ca2+-binding RTX toxin-like protein
MFRAPKFAAGLAACVIASVAATAHADVFVDTSTPGLVLVNGTDHSDEILMGTLCDGSILAIRYSGLLCLDIAFIDASLVPTSVIIVSGGEGHDYIDAWCVDDSATLEIHGDNGDDAIYGGAGADLVFGEDGSDYISTGAGNDTLFGGLGWKDRLLGGIGDDSMSDDDGVAAAQGGKGFDFIFVNFDAAWDNNFNPLDTRKSIGAISGGADDDMVSLVVNGSPMLLNVDGDGGPGPQGAFDQIDVTGATDSASAYPNFEFSFFLP